MRGVTLPVVTLLLCLGLCLAQSRAVTAREEQWQQRLEEIAALDVAETEAPLRELYEDWRKCDFWLRATAEHEDIDAVEEGFREALSAAEEGEESDLAAALAGLSVRLRFLRMAAAVTWEYVL